MSIVFTVQSEERVLCTSKPLIWEAVQWGWGGVCGGGVGLEGGKGGSEGTGNKNRGN